MTPDPSDTAGDVLALPTGMELVCASGFCDVCDSRFYDERVLRFEARSSPTGYGYIHVRHLHEPDLQYLWAERPASASSSSAHPPGR